MRLNIAATKRASRTPCAVTPVASTARASSASTSAGRSVTFSSSASVARSFGSIGAVR